MSACTFENPCGFCYLCDDRCACLDTGYIKGKPCIHCVAGAQAKAYEDEMAALQQEEYMREHAR